MLRLVTLAALLCCWSSATFAQAPAPDTAEVMQQLLALPAPTPRKAQSSDAAEPREPRPEKFFDRTNPPADDAPLVDVLEYWLRWTNSTVGPVLSEVNKQRLLDACTQDIRMLTAYVSVFPAEESTAKRIKDVYDKALSEPSNDISLDTVKNWLMFKSKFFVHELFARASRLKEDNKTGSIDNQEALVALARLDWQTAEPLVKGLASGSQPRSSALALTLLYQQAISDKDLDGEEKYRSRLKTIASDRNAPGRARDTSIEALSKTEWSGRDDWYLSLLADDSLRETFDGNYGFSPLTTLFNRDPDKWIPIMARLVESKDRAVQQAAASCLVIYATNHPRRDAILPVLRWLSDPNWLQLRSGTQRAWFMQVMNRLEIPESVPGLIWIVENEEEHRQWAARQLAHYKDPRAIPVLRKALLKSREDERRLILDGLIASGGLPDSEGVAALEAYAAKRMTAEGREDIERFRAYDAEPLPLPISIGRYLATVNDVPESLARAVLARAESLKKTNPALAESLLSTTNLWQGRAVDLDMIQQIASGSAGVNTIATALEKRARLRETLGAELQMLLERTDEALGVGAVLLNDPQVAQSILTSENQQPQISLLAAARLTQTPLPVDLVGRLLPSKNPLLALAAKRYLLAEDSKDARKLLWQHHPDQAFVTGWRENYEDIDDSNFEPLAKAEEKLRAELFKEDGPLEIFALIGNSEQRYSYILRIYANKATYTHYEDNSRYLERVISQAELAAFKDLVVTAGLEDLGPQFNDCHHNCWVAEFLSLKKSEPWRVFSYGPFSTFDSLLAKFEQLGRGEGARIRYDLESEIKGLEVLYADNNLLVKDVWQGNDEIRIFVERPETEEELKQRYTTEDDDGDYAAANAERQRKALALKKTRISWRKLDGNKATAVVAQPPGYTTFDETNFPTDDGTSVDHGIGNVQLVSHDTIVIARSFAGLWKQVAGRKAVQIGDENGNYGSPIATADGKWVVLAKTDTDWSKPNYIVRFNLQTGQEFRVKVEPAPELNPVAFLPVRDRVLLRRGQDEYDVSGKRLAVDPPEYFLLDAATGETQKVSGEFTPFLQEGKRFLQPTSQPQEFWAAIPDEAKNQTRVGRYSLKDFSFKEVMVVPQISFESLAMWVDEKRGKLYFVYRDQLLSLPLKTTASNQPR